MLVQSGTFMYHAVVDKAADSKRFIQRRFLSLVWVRPEPVANHVHKPSLPKHVVKHNQKENVFGKTLSLVSHVAKARWLTAHMIK